MQLNFLLTNVNTAGIIGERPGKDLHKRTLTGTVFPHKRMNFTDMSLKVNRVHS